PSIGRKVEIADAARDLGDLARPGAAGRHPPQLRVSFVIVLALAIFLAGVAQEEQRLAVLRPARLRLAVFRRARELQRFAALLAAVVLPGHHPDVAARLVELLVAARDGVRDALAIGRERRRGDVGE